MAIATPPTTPARTMPQSIFSPAMDAYLSWITYSLVPGLNAISGITSTGLFSDGSAASPAQSFINSTGMGFYRAGANRLAIANAGVYTGEFDASGRLFLGSPTAITGIGNPKFQTEGTGSPQAQWTNGLFVANASGPSISFAKSRAGALDTYTIVQAGDTLGNFEWWGADGVTMQRGATITSVVFGTPAAGIVQSNMKFNVASAAGAMVNRLTITDALATFNVPVTNGLNALSAGTLALALATNINVSVTPNATGTFTTTVPPAGTFCSLTVNTSGVTSFTMTFGSGFKSQGTLATGTTTGKTFTMEFVSDGATLNELSRTTAM